MYLSTLDYVMLAVILIFLIRGIIRGFINDVFGFGSLVIAVFSGVKLYPLVQENMNWNMPVLICSILSFLIVFVIVYLIMKIIQLVVKGIFSLPLLRSLDRALGLVLGACLGIMIVCVILFVFSQFDVFEGIRNQSILYNFFMNIAEDSDVLKVA